MREQKRAQFEEPRRRSTLHIVLAGVTLLIVVAAAAAFVSSRGGGATEPATTQAATGGDVKIALADVGDGKAHFYSYDAGGTQVKFFVLKSSDGKVRAAFDACDVCYAQKKGYHQEGDEMVCNNCGRRFPSTKINEVEGGCNPSPVDRTIKGDTLILKTADLQTGVQYFQ
ncbi:MAG: DUF2318 domain-containing protein [Actinobacteria bacterium]|nr:DUF2318 domain-containing protein [Actinomycetota bacterium]